MALNANALVDLPSVKTWVKLTSGVTQDDVLELLINAFSDEAEQLTNRVLKSRVITEVRSGRGTSTLMPRQWPITNISSIVIDSNGKFTGDPLDSAEYAVSDDGLGIVYYGGAFTRGYANVKLVYTAGYVTVPGDLQQAMRDLVYWRYRTRESGDIGRKQKGRESESEQWHQEWPPGPLAVVMRYKRCEFMED